ncbi:hypothetical protein C5748_26955 [Phyllobacterium phragmitis]|uniref:Uncharacterized protein n=1 Tax=Phyllobacterium phragmitis TaxID=2670329 RepID=A0A2S9IIW8_9HYPH|nr:hypothetical protein C5748_26955 [Phyllobacterium phragmitis]
MFRGDKRIVRKTGAGTAVLVGLGLILAGCGGREAHPVAITNPTDSAFDCAGISREFAANERQILTTLKERTQAQGKNIALGAAGVFFFPAFFFMDPKSPEKVEIDALRNRNKVLEDIARSKKCSPPRSQLTEIYKKLDDPRSTQPAKVRN